MEKIEDVVWRVEECWEKELKKKKRKEWSLGWGVRLERVVLKYGIRQ